ncbi:unnamed protein product, partial [Mesorhabditis spiculigera]
MHSMLYCLFFAVVLVTVHADIQNQCATWQDCPKDHYCKDGMCAEQRNIERGELCGGRITGGCTLGYRCCSQVKGGIGTCLEIGEVCE